MINIGNIAVGFIIGFEFNSFAPNKTDGTMSAITSLSVFVHKLLDNSTSSIGVTSTANAMSLATSNPHKVRIDTGSNASWWTVGEYTVVAGGSTAVGGVSVVGTVLAHFSIANRIPAADSASGVATVNTLYFGGSQIERRTDDGTDALGWVNNGNFVGINISAINGDADKPRDLNNAIPNLDAAISEVKSQTDKLTFSGTLLMTDVETWRGSQPAVLSAGGFVKSDNQSLVLLASSQTFYAPLKATDFGTASSSLVTQLNAIQTAQTLLATGWTVVGGKIVWTVDNLANAPSGGGSGSTINTSESTTFIRDR